MAEKPTKAKVVEITETLTGCMNPGGILNPEAWTGVDEVLRSNEDGTLRVYALGIVERDAEQPMEQAA